MRERIVLHWPDISTPSHGSRLTGPAGACGEAATPTTRAACHPAAAADVGPASLLPATFHQLVKVGLPTEPLAQSLARAFRAPCVLLNEHGSTRAHPSIASDSQRSCVPAPESAPSPSRQRARCSNAWCWLAVLEGHLSQGRRSLNSVVLLGRGQRTTLARLRTARPGPVPILDALCACFLPPKPMRNPEATCCAFRRSAARSCRARDSLPLTPAVLGSAREA